MNFRIFLDLDKLDEKVRNMSSKEKEDWINKANNLTELTEELLKSKKISKIVYNRVMNIWSFSPYQNVDFMSSNKFNQLMGIKPINLKFMNDAIVKVLKISELYPQNNTQDKKKVKYE